MFWGVMMLKSAPGYAVAKEKSKIMIRILELNPKIL